jgi:hypothetical protein
LWLTKATIGGGALERLQGGALPVVADQPSLDEADSASVREVLVVAASGERVVKELGGGGDDTSVDVGAELGRNGVGEAAEAVFADLLAGALAAEDEGEAAARVPQKKMLGERGGAEVLLDELGEARERVVVVAGSGHRRAPKVRLASESQLVY